MNVKEQIDDKYKTIVARLGDLEFRKYQIDEQIEDIRKSIQALSTVAPLLEDVKPTEAHDAQEEKAQ